MAPEKAFGEVLRHLRKERGLSQEALALEAGVERNYISLLELGKSNASMRMLFKICAVLDLPPSKFLEQVEAKFKDRGHRKRHTG